MTPTPRTDAEARRMTIDCDDSCVEIYVNQDGKPVEGDIVLADFARTLETELTHANNRAHNWEQATIAHLKDKDQLHADIAELNERLIDHQQTLMSQAIKLQAASRLLTRCRDSAGRMEMELYMDIQYFLNS